MQPLPGDCNVTLLNWQLEPLTTDTIAYTLRADGLAARLRR